MRGKSIMSMKDVNEVTVKIKDGNLIIDEKMFPGGKIKIDKQRKIKFVNGETQYHSILTLDEDVVKAIGKVLK